VLVDSVGEPAPLPPVDGAGWIDQFGTPSRIEQTAEKVAPRADKSPRAEPVPLPMELGTPPLYYFVPILFRLDSWDEVRAARDHRGAVRCGSADEGRTIGWRL
jgi:hypothetical protein